MARPLVTLRTEKGSALTYNEMDQNFSSFFYSASVVSTAGSNVLKLHYTGSGNLDTGFQPGSVSVTLPEPVIPDTNITVPGENSQIIFNENGNLGADSLFTFLSDVNNVGIGVSSPQTHIDIKSIKKTQPAQIQLTGGNSSFDASRAFYSVKAGTLINDLVRIGKNKKGASPTSLTYGATNQIAAEILVNNSSVLNIGTLSGTGATETCKIFQKVTNQGTLFGNSLTNELACSPISVIGDISIGSSDSIIPSNLNTIGGNSVSAQYITTDTSDNINTNGLLIQSPKSSQGGHVVVGINTDGSKCEGFSIVKGTQGSFDTVIANFKADGKVGIGTVSSKEVLDVRGNITGSGNATFDSNLYAKGKGCVQTISEFAILTTDFASSNEEYYKTVISSGSKGELQYVDASPVPKGGIIMWSGDINNMPKGWRLCDGSGTVNGVAIPDLRNKFVVGSTSDSSGTSYPDVSTGATGTGAYTPAGTIEINKLPLNTIPPHHHFFVGDDQLYNKVCNIDGENCFNNIGGVSTSGTTPSSNNRCVLGYDANSTTGGNKDRRLYKTSKQSCTTDGSNEVVQTTANQCKPTGTFSGAATTILPPYYALAFIIYVGAA